MGVVRFRDEQRCNFRQSRAWRRAGKTRTWWHPLLARLLDYVLATGYSVFEEVLVGKLPLRVDILLIRRLGGQLSEAAQRDLSALVSHVFLDERQRIMEELNRTGHSALLCYVLQQVRQFRKLGEDFAMQHKDSEYLGQLDEELETAVLETIPPERVLRRYTPEQRLHGMSAEDVAGGLSDEELARLRDILERRRSK